MTMKMKRITNHNPFHSKQLEVLLKMNKVDFSKLVVAFKGGSLKGVGFKHAKFGNFDEV